MPSSSSFTIDASVPIVGINDATASQLVRTFTFAPIPGLNFQPGQYAMISVGDLAPLPMAFASGPHDPVLQFTVRLSSHGGWAYALTARLFDARVGDIVRIQGPCGTFFPWQQIQEDTPLILVAGGTGITPIRSLVHTLGARGRKVVFYGAKNPAEVVYADGFELWRAAYNTDVFLTVEHVGAVRDRAADRSADTHATGFANGRVAEGVDAVDDDAPWPHAVGYVTGIIDSAQRDFDLGRGHNPRALAFVCGPDPMMAAAVRSLRNRGLSDASIYVSVAKIDQDGRILGPVLPVTDPHAAV